MSDSNELYYAEMGAARGEAQDAYFDARPQLVGNLSQITYCSIFRAGFERGFQAAWNKRESSPPETGAANCERHGQIIETGCPACEAAMRSADRPRDANGSPVVETSPVLDHAYLPSGDPDCCGICRCTKASHRDVTTLNRGVK